MKTAVVMILLVFVVSVPLATQTLTEQLQKGIYTEETLRNRDEAVRIYRQIIAAPAVPRSIAEEAQRRLARLLIAVQPPVVAADRAAVPRETGLGAVDRGRYRHFSSGITFDLPPGWTASQTYPSSDGGDMLTLTHEATKRSINVWMIKEDTPAARVAERLAGAPAEKVRQRHSGYGIPGMHGAHTYEISPQSVQPTMINGQQAMIAVGTYLGVPLESLPTGVVSEPRASVRMNEYMTWIYTQQSRAFFFARVPEGYLPELRPAFEQLVYSAIVP